MSEYQSDPETSIHLTEEGMEIFKTEWITEFLKYRSDMMGGRDPKTPPRPPLGYKSNIDYVSMIIESQQAQIKGLVEALGDYSNENHWRDYCENVYKYQQGYLEAQKALSTLPAEFLERERKREAVVRAAMEWSKVKLNDLDEDDRTTKTLNDAVMVLSSR